MIATVHPIAEVLGELLAQYEARGLMVEGSTGREAGGSQPAWNRVSAPLRAEKPSFEAALGVCGQLS